MLFGSKKYIYLSVCFRNGGKTYAYRTDNKNIKLVESCKPAKEIPKDELGWIDELAMLDAIFDDR